MNNKTYKSIILCFTFIFNGCVGMPNEMSHGIENVKVHENTINDAINKVIIPPYSDRVEGGGYFINLIDYIIENLPFDLSKEHFEKYFGQTMEQTDGHEFGYNPAVSYSDAYIIKNYKGSNISFEISKRNYAGKLSHSISIDAVGGDHEKCINLAKVFHKAIDTGWVSDSIDFKGPKNISLYGRNFHLKKNNMDMYIEGYGGVYAGYYDAKNLERFIGGCAHSVSFSIPIN